MKDEILKIKEKFDKIKKIGWIESKRVGSTGVGYTLEFMFNTDENNLEIPDLNIFELKAQRNFSNSYITLFNATPDGDYLFEIERLRKQYGYPDKDFKQYKIVNCDVFANKITNLGAKYKQTIKINTDEEKIRLNILNNDLNLIDNEISWSFKLIKDKFKRKLQFLTFVEAEKKTVNGKEYFKYKDIVFYEAYSFDKFIELLTKGIIKITFKIGIFKSGKRQGQVHDHGTGFSIKKENLNFLYKKII